MNKSPADWIESVPEFRSTTRRLPHLEKPGSWYFVDAKTDGNQILSPQERDIVLNSFLFLNGVKYDLDSLVIMPDHFHAILKPLEKSEGAYYSLREIFHSIKSYTSKEILRSRGIRREGAARDTSRIDYLAHGPKTNRTGVHIWQDETYDHILRNEKDHSEKLNYLIYNPVVAGLVSEPFEYRWLWCSFRQQK